MSLKTIDVAFGNFGLAAMLLVYIPFKLYSRTTKYRSDGRERKYICSNMSVIGLGIFCCCELGRTFVALMSGSYFSAGIFLLYFILFSYVLYREIKNDNWFNRSYKKMKRGFKNMRRWLKLFNQSIAPSPA